MIKLLKEENQIITNAREKDFLSIIIKLSTCGLPAHDQQQNQWLPAEADYWAARPSFTTYWLKSYKAHFVLAPGSCDGGSNSITTSQVVLRAKEVNVENHWKQSWH